MASVTKSVSGSTTTFAVTDMTGAIATMSVVGGGVTGNTVQFSGAAVHNDAVALMANLMLQLETGLVPGNGAQGLIP